MAFAKGYNKKYDTPSKYIARHLEQYHSAKMGLITKTFVLPKNFIKVRFELYRLSP